MSERLDRAGGRGRRRPPIDLRPGPSSSVMAMAGTKVPTFTVRSLNEWSPSADARAAASSSSSVITSTLGVTARTCPDRSFAEAFGDHPSARPRCGAALTRRGECDSP